MQPDFSQFGPFLLAALVVFVIYRRFRRTFGRQPLRPARMMFRIGLFIVLACAISPVALRSNAFLAALLGGAVAGVALALFGAQRTRFVMYQDRLHYVPHTYTGVAVASLFLGRLVYRFVQTYQAAHAAHAEVAAADPSQAFAAGSMVRSPLTVGLFFVLIGYYVCYYSLLLYKSKHIKQEDVEVIPAVPRGTT